MRILRLKCPFQCLSALKKTPQKLLTFLNFGLSIKTLNHIRPKTAIHTQKIKISKTLQRFKIKSQQTCPVNPSLVLLQQSL